jgi:hypothetical protein
MRVRNIRRSGEASEEEKQGKNVCQRGVSD